MLKPLARSKKPRDLAGWPLLLQLPESAVPYLGRAVRLLARQKRLPGGLAPKLQGLLAEPAQPQVRVRVRVRVRVSPNPNPNPNLNPNPNPNPLDHGGGGRGEALTRTLTLTLTLNPNP